MNDLRSMTEMISLAERAVACSLWHWIPGMRLIHYHRGLGMTLTHFQRTSEQPRVVPLSEVGLADFLSDDDEDDEPIFNYVPAHQLWFATDEMIEDEDGLEWVDQSRVSIPVENPKFGLNCLVMPDLGSDATIGCLLGLVLRMDESYRINDMSIQPARLVEALESLSARYDSSDRSRLPTLR